jgi:hypothetical protein
MNLELAVLRPVQEQEREHVVAEVVRVHRPAQLVGDVAAGPGELFWSRSVIRGP